VVGLIELLYIILALAGAIFCLVGSLGIARFPDLYTRIQASTLCTIGVLWFGLAIVFRRGIDPLSAKTLVVVLFVYLTAPVASHAIARAGYKSGVRPCRQNVIDEYRGRR